MKPLILISTLTLYSISIFAQQIFVKDSYAIRGYDPVAYFTKEKAVLGSDKFVHEWNGAMWKFASQENLDLFKSNPEKYAPQFGGYCAYGVSDGEGHKSPTSPDAFTIVGGKLYLNYNLKVKELWNADQAHRIKTGEANWPQLRKHKED
jgi:YHS domain-containing protein